MPTSGEIYQVDLGEPIGHEAGGFRPAVVVSAQMVSDGPATEVHPVPLTATLCDYESEVAIVADPANGLEVASAAQCQHLRSVSVERLGGLRGNAGPVALADIREVLADLLDIAI